MKHTDNPKRDLSSRVTDKRKQAFSHQFYSKFFPDEAELSVSLVPNSKNRFKISPSTVVVLLSCMILSE